MSHIALVSSSDEVCKKFKDAYGSDVICNPTLGSEVQTASRLVLDLNGDVSKWEPANNEFISTYDGTLIIIYNKPEIMPEWDGVFEAIGMKVPIVSDNVEDAINCKTEMCVRNFMSSSTDSELKRVVPVDYIYHGEILSKDAITAYLTKNVNALNIAVRHFTEDKLTTDLSEKLAEICKFKQIRTVNELDNYLNGLVSTKLSEADINQLIRSSRELREMGAKYFNVPVDSELLSINMFFEAKNAKVCTEEQLYNLFTKKG